MNTAYFAVIGVAVVAIIAFYAMSFRGPRSFAPANGKRSRKSRRIVLVIVCCALAALYAWLLRRLLT